MSTKDKLSMGFTGVLTICALFIVGFIIQQNFFHKKPQPQIQKRIVKNWQQLKFKGQRAGPKDAPVQIAEFFDYQCPFCKSSEPALKAMRKKYPKEVAIVHINDPLNKIHQYAYGASIAAECVRRINPSIFMDYHDALFTRQNMLGHFSYAQLAFHVGISDTTTFNRCVKQKETAGILNAGKDLARKLNIHGTPAFLVNSTLIIGEVSKRQLNGLVKGALTKVN
jgi:protein-disulfide isomerase